MYRFGVSYQKKNHTRQMLSDILFILAIFITLMLSFYVVQVRAFYDELLRFNVDLLALG